MILAMNHFAVSLHTQKDFLGLGVFLCISRFCRGAEI